MSVCVCVCVCVLVRVRAIRGGLGVKSSIIERIRRIGDEEGEKAKRLCQFLTRIELQNLLLVMNNASEGLEPTHRNLRLSACALETTALSVNKLYHNPRALRLRIDYMTPVDMVQRDRQESKNI